MRLEACKTILLNKSEMLERAPESMPVGLGHTDLEGVSHVETALLEIWKTFRGEGLPSFVLDLTNQKKHLPPAFFCPLGWA